jgi:protein TonB
MSASKFVSAPDTLEILFANRNRAYGAYQLRRAYPAYLQKAFGLFVLLAASALTTYIWLHNRADWMGQEAPPTQVINCPILPPEAPPSVPPPPPPPPAPPVRPTLAFPPPVVMIDDQVNETPQNPVELLANSNADIGLKNHDGDPNARPDLGTPDFGPPGVVENQAAPPDEIKGIFDVQVMPSFPGGETEMMKYLAKNTVYPSLASESGIEGSVVLSFVVNKDGSISDITTLKDIGGGCGKEAIRVLKSMPPWTPGEANGHPVRVRFTMPFRFKLN